MAGDRLPQQLYEAWRDGVGQVGERTVAPWSVIGDGGRRPLDVVAAAARRLVRQEVLDTLSGLVAEFGAERAVAMLEETLFGTREEPS